MSKTKRWLVMIVATLAVVVLVYLASIGWALPTSTHSAKLNDQGDPIAGPTVFTDDAPQR